MPKAKQKTVGVPVVVDLAEEGAGTNATPSRPEVAGNTADESDTSSLGHEDFFEKDLRKFLRESREAVATGKKRFEAAQRKADSDLASLADRRAKFDRQEELKERVLLHAIRSLPVSGPKASDPKVVQKQEDLRHRLQVMRKRKLVVAESIESEIKDTEEQLYRYRKEYGQVLTDYERKRDEYERRSVAGRADAQVDQFRTMEFLKRAENRPPGSDATAAEQFNYEEDLKELRHLRNIRKANETYQEYLGNNVSKRKRISPPRPTDPPAKRTRVAPAVAATVPREDAIDVAAKSIAIYIRDWLEADGTEVGDEDTEIALTGPPEVDTDEQQFIHERQLEDTLKPETLQTPGWTAPPYVLSSHETDGQTGEEMFSMMRKMLVNQEMQMRALHLHSLALSTTIQSLGDLKATVVGDVRKDVEAAALIKKANQAVKLASDPDLKRLPFRNVFELTDFFRGRDSKRKVEKLSQYVLTYVPFIDKVYVASLADAIFHPDLQEKLFWTGYPNPKPR